MTRINVLSLHQISKGPVFFRFFGKMLLIFFLLQFAVLPVRSQFSEMVRNLEEYNRKTLNERVFLHTDREVYAPGDTLWFKAYVRNESSLYKSDFSRDLFVYLADGEGRVITDTRYLINDSGSKGQLVLNEKLDEGVYTLVVYSSWMKNFGVEEVFSKRIEMRYETRTTYRLVPTYGQKRYFPGDTVNMQVKCYDNLRQEVEEVSFVYRVFSGNKKLASGSANMYNGFENHIDVILPVDIQETCRIELRGVHKEIELDEDYKMPVFFDLHVDFFPEGGRALNGMMSRMAFKASYVNGKPAEIEGEVVDEQGTVRTTIATEHNGMGVFPFIPQKDKAYHLKIQKPSGIDRQYALPRGREQGWMLSAKSHANQIHVDIQKRGARKDTCLLTLMVRGYLFYSRVVTVAQSQSITIPTDTLPAGIGVLTLVDGNMLPRAERLVFANYHRRNQVEMTPNSKKYLPREKVELDIQVTGPGNKPVQGDYSLTVVDEKLGLSKNIHHPNVFSAGYFTQEIRGRVWDPEYYFQTGSRRERHHLDLLLMTQGWRNYRYLEQANRVDSLPDPVNQDVVSGTILKKRSIFEPKPTPGKLIIYFGGNSYTLHADEQGRFSFLPAFKSGINPNIFMSATDDNGKDNVIIQLDSNDYRTRLMDYLNHLTDSLSRGVTSRIYTYENIEKLYETSDMNNFWINAITVMAKRQREHQDAEEYIADEMFINSMKANDSWFLYAYDVFDVLRRMGSVKRVGETAQYFYNGEWRKIKWIVNGRELDSAEEIRVQYYNPKAIENLYLLRGAATAAYWFDGDPNQVMELGESPYVVCYIAFDPNKDRMMEGNLQQYKRANQKMLQEYTLKKEFYSPVYDTEKKKEDPLPDLRQTIHWEPHLNLDSAGRATITFYNADRYARIKCILQGISDKGIPSYGETNYEVFFMKE